MSSTEFKKQNCSKKLCNVPINVTMSARRFKKKQPHGCRFYMKLVQNMVMLDLITYFIFLASPLFASLLRETTSSFVTCNFQLNLQGKNLTKKLEQKNLV